MASIGKEIKKLMIDAGLKTNQLAEELKISRVTLYRKLNGELEFGRKEIQELIKIFDLSNDDAIRIFFTDKVS